MATNKKNKINIQIDFSSNIKTLEDIKKNFEDISTNEKLVSKQGNTLKSTYTSISSLFTKLSDLQKDNGVVTTSEMKKIQSEYEKIKLSIQNIKEAEELAFKKKSAQLDVEKKKTNELKNSLKQLQDARNEKQQAANSAKDGLKALKSGNLSSSTISKLSETQYNLYKEGGMDLVQSTAKKHLGQSSDEDKAKIQAARDLIKLQEEEIKQAEKLVDDAEKEVAEYQKKVDLAQQSVDVNAANITKLGNEANAAQANVENLKNKENELDESLGKVKKQTDMLVKSGEKQAQVTDKIESTTTKLIRTGLLYRGVMSGIRKVLNASVKNVVEMDKALTDMSIVTGESRKELYQLIPTLNQMGQMAGTTATEMASLTAEYMKQGRSQKDSMELAIQTAKAAKIAGISTGDSIQYMTSAINGFNLAATDAQRVSDIFAKVGAATATDYEQLAVALSKVSAQANTAGLSIEFTTALLAKGIETTQEAPESIGTALKTVFARMRELTDYGSVLEDDTSINKVERALASAGVELRNTTGEFRDLEEVFKELGPKWDNLNTMQQQAIAQAVAGTRQQSRFLAIMQDWDRTLEISNTTLDSAGASTYQFSQYQKSLGYSITQVTTAWQGLTSGLANVDVIKGAIDGVAELINNVNKFLNLWDGRVGDFTIIVTAIGLMAIKFRLAWLEAQRVTQEKIEQIAAAKGISNEEAKQLVNDKKHLTFLQRMTLQYEKQAALIKNKNKIENKTEKISVKNAKDLLKTQEKGKKFTDNRTKGAKELAKLSQSQKLSEQDQLKVATALNTAKASSVSLEEKEIADKIIKAGLTQDQVNDELAIAASQGVGLTVEEATIAAKIREGLLTEDEVRDNKEISNENSKQYLLMMAKLQAQGKLNVGQQVEATNDKKSLPAKMAGAIANVFKSLPTPVAIGVAAALAAVIGGIAIGGIVSATKAKNREETISSNQEKIYEGKEKKTNLKSLRDEYATLYDAKMSGLATTEELDRLDEITKELQEIDGTIVGEGQDLLNKIDDVIETIDENNLELAKESKKLATETAQSTTFGEVMAHVGLQAASALLGPVGTIWGSHYHDEIQKAMDVKQAGKAFDASTEEGQKNILALRETASGQFQADHKNMDASKMNESLAAIDAMYSRMDWKKFAEGVAEAGEDLGEAFDKFEKTVSEAAFNMANSDKLADKIQAYEDGYNKIVEEFGADSDAAKHFENQNAIYKNLIPFEEDIRTLETTTDFTGDKILNLVSSLRAAGVEAGAVGENLKKIAKAGGDFESVADGIVNEMIGKMYSDDIEYWARMSGKEVSKLTEMTEGEFTNLKQTLIDTYSAFTTNGVTAANIKDKRDRFVDSNDNRTTILEELASGTLSSESKDYLAEYFGELYANPEFQKALANGGAAAITMFKQAVEDEHADTIEGAEKLVKQKTYQQSELLKEYGFGSYEDFLKSGGTGNKDIDATIKNNQIEIQKFTDYVEQMKDFGLEVEKIDEYASAMSDIDAELEGLSDKTDKASFDRAQKLYEDRAKAAEDKFNETLANTAKAMGIPLEDMNKYYKIVDGKLIPKAEELNKLDGEQRQIWLNNQDALSEYNDTKQESIDLAEESRQAEFDAALEAQEYMLDMYKAKLEKENEALQESLDKRAEMYEKYFDSLEEDEESADYETERQKLINRIASLSTATDSASLSKLKEAQKELADLNKDRATSQRELRREAVAERFEAQKEDAEKALEATLADGNELLKRLIEGLEDGSLSLLDLGKDSGAFEGLTSLGMASWFQEASKYANTFSSFDFASMFTGVGSPTIDASGVTNNSSSASIVNNINLADKLNDPQQRAQFNAQITEFFNNLMIQWGLNPNANPY